MSAMDSRAEAALRAAQAVLDTHDAWDAAEAEHFSNESMSKRMLCCEAFVQAKAALRAALALPAGGARSEGGSTLPGAMHPEFVHAREVAVALDRWRGGEAPDAIERDYGFPGGMLAALPAGGAADDEDAPILCPWCGSCGIGGCCGYYCDRCKHKHDEPDEARRVDVPECGCAHKVRLAPAPEKECLVEEARRERDEARVQVDTLCKMVAEARSETTDNRVASLEAVVRHATYQHSPSHCRICSDALRALPPAPEKERTP